MSRHPSPHRGRSAFTIVELVLVVLVISILTAVAAPKYGAALASYRASTAARRVATDLRLARNYARKASQATTVTFDAAANSYGIAPMPDLDRPDAAYAVNLSASPYSADVTSATFGAGAAVQFDIYGRPSNSGSVVVASGLRQHTVQLDAAGNVSIP